MRKFATFDFSALASAMKLGTGVLTSSFDYSHSSLKEDREQTYSAERLIFDYSLPAWKGRVESRLDLTVEGVGGDARSLSFLTAAGGYVFPYSERIQLRMGLAAHSGRTYLWNEDVLAPVSATGLGEVRQGMRPFASLAWNPEFGGVFEAGYRPGVEAALTQSLLRLYPMLDTLARGSIVQTTSLWIARYERRIPSFGRIEGSIERRRDLHRPYIVSTGADVWSVITRRSEATKLSLKAEASLPRGIGAGVGLAIVSEETASTVGDSEAPFISPFELSGDVSVPFGREITAAADFRFAAGAATDFAGRSKTKSESNLNLTAHWRFTPGIRINGGVRNALSSREVAAPGYDSAGITLWAGAEWRGVPLFY